MLSDQQYNRRKCFFLSEPEGVVKNASPDLCDDLNILHGEEFDYESYFSDYKADVTIEKGKKFCNENGETLK